MGIDESSDASISVVIPTRDRPDFVMRAISSALSQKDVTVEVIVVDDGGYEALSLDSHPRVRVIRNDTSQGVSAARNRGIAEARYSWLAFLDDDDYWSPWKLSRQLAAAVAEGTLWSVCGAVLVDIEGNEISIHLPAGDAKKVAQDLCRFNSVPGGGSGVLMHRSLISEMGGFFDGLSMVADWELWHRVAHRYSLALVDEPLVAYTQHDFSMSQTFDGYEAEMHELDGSTQYCHDDTDERRLIYDAWLAAHVAKTNRKRAARISLQVAVKRKSLRHLVRTVRYLLIPHTFSGRRALRLTPKNSPSEPLDWLDPYRAANKSA